MASTTEQGGCCACFTTLCPSQYGLPLATVPSTHAGIECEIAMIPALVGFSVSTFNIVVVIMSMLMVKRKSNKSSLSWSATATAQTAATWASS